MVVEESPPYRIGFADDVDAARIHLRELFSRHNLLPEKLEYLFLVFCDHFSGHYVGNKPVRKWKSLWIAWATRYLERN